MTRETAKHFAELVKRLNIQSILGRRGQQLFCGEDDLFSWAAAGVGRGFGIFPGLQLTHLIFSGRLTREYFLRLVHGQQFSQAVMAYLLTGVRQPSRISLAQKTRILRHAGPKGAFAMRFEWASARGRQLAARFISEHQLRPINHQEREAGATGGAIVSRSIPA